MENQNEIVLEIENHEHPGAEQNQLLLEWHAPEFINHPKTKTWFLMAGILVIGLVVYALLTGSATMAIVFIVLAGVYALTHSQQPKIITIKLTELGIYVGKTFHPYNMISSFWIVYHPPYVHTLNLRLGNKSSTLVTIQLNLQNPVEVRELLAKEVPEVEGEQENMTNLISRMMRL